MKDINFGIIVGSRGFFNPKLAQEGRKEVLAKLDGMGYGYIALSEQDTQYGAVETAEDAIKCAKLFRENYEKIDGIIVILPNFSDEIGIVNTIDQAKLDVPVLIQASDDDTDKMDIESRRDSFCGKLSVCNNLYQYGIKFSNTSTHTYPISSKEFSDDIDHFAKVCKVVKGIKTARLAQIGTRPAAFQTVRYSEKLLQESGVTVIPVDLSEIIGQANAMKDTKAVKDKLLEIKAYGSIPDYIKEENIVKSAKLGLVVENFISENKCVAGAIQCWSSIQENYGCASCLPMSMLGEKGIHMACETDITGALSMYALKLASDSPSGYLDWNNNYMEDRNKCINIHCSNYPKSFIGTDFEISNLDILGSSIGFDVCFGACKANIAAGKMTFAKISTDDNKGKIRAYFGEGEFTDDPVDSPGGIAVCSVGKLQELLDYICQNGFEHHVSMNRTSAASILNEAFGKYLEWDIYWHK